MAEFCRCGSIMISGSCTNKSCSNKLVKATPSRVKKVATTKSTITATTVKTVKSTKVPRASKCITYNISELPPKEE